MEIAVHPDDQVNMSGSSASLNVMAALFDLCSEEGRVAVLSRHARSGADLVIGRGTDTPIDFPAYRRLRDALRHTRRSPEPLRDARPEMSTDRYDQHWRQRQLMTVRTQEHAVLLSGSSYGLRLCALDCLHLACSDRADHEHWADWGVGTSKSVEFIIRNRDNGWRGKAP